MSRSSLFVTTFGIALAAASVPDTSAAQVPAADAFQRSYDLEAQGLYAAALTALEQAAAPRPSYLFALRRGWLLYLAARHDEAIVAYRQAIAAAPKAVESRLGLMLPQMALRRWQDALSTGEEILALDADNYLAASRRAFCLYNLGRFPQAESAYAGVLQLYPADVEMGAGLGWSLLKQGKKAAAAEQFRRVLSVAPVNGSARTGLAAAELE